MPELLRDQPEGAFFQEEAAPPEIPDQKHGKNRHRNSMKGTGLTVFQRFVLSVMFFFMICLLGFMLLIFTGKIVLPFIY